MKFNIIRDLDGEVSLSRSFLIMLLLLAIIKFWYLGIDIPGTMETILMSLLAYELGKKGRDTYIKTKIPEQIDK